ncbi:FprA family A-type flavoprotein [Romboutsia sp. 1001216sp1]|uniref:FprA family A-type flavoprotein n=1 Tax=unclassified Romboutsia TaxID=2626894 RepID=UPI00189E3A80|nr:MULTISPECIES: FprA family A-type flavoprotein [unclassified Romboutsia]MDB8790188.1 FprA family A-type flavoprotein [Romboutsia sp. 1001216sp1]MDB8800624.1 FprA family A-type flavoprotein [Romboutsia sp. 1001216sp1]MDB8812023.1 FprA family A-type flavoprotein [Romboutsia sp. 1001216sp1]
MSNVFEVKKDIYFTGVVDKDLKVFDIIMETEFGTTYNCYVIKDEKTVLFDTVKPNFKDEFLKNVSEVTDIKDIDYVVIHHTEPDHAGCLKYILDINPDVEVYCTAVAKTYLAEQVNRPFKCHVIKDGETLNIGKRNLKFITAPFLHWADTMFTYVEEDKTLFTCDAFGCHFASVDPNAVESEDYLKSAKHYYDCIVKPFAKHVLSAINKVVELKIDFDTILTSHGPMLTKDPMAAVKRYLDWSTEVVNTTNQNQVAIFYLSAYTNTLEMAKNIEKGLVEEGAEVKLYDLEELDLKEMHDAVVMSKVILLGSPTINRTMVKPMWDLFSTIDPMANQGKIAGVFGSYGWSGEGITMAENLLKAMAFKMPVPTMKKKFFPSEETCQECVNYGKEFAKLVK